MKFKSVQEIARLYTNYFQEKGHTIVPSSSLIPKGDPTLLFTTAGMVQFKPLFTGAVELPYTRAASIQKCVRTTDLEVVGKTERHCTFFEMLGNFSFGDYFKKEAIEYALDFSLNKLEIPKDKIWVTIYLDDDEAKKIWMDAGIPEERIVRLGKKIIFGALLETVVRVVLVRNCIWIGGQKKEAQIVATTPIANLVVIVIVI